MGGIAKRWRWAVLAAALFACFEAAVRFAGLVDFPVYQVAPDVGYIVAPSQSGRFLRSHDWAFNDRSMPVASDWQPKGTRQQVLLIGNSIIMGGNPYRQADKIAPLVQGGLGDSVAVWPMAIGGWTVANEAAYIDRHAEVAASTDAFVWQVMRGGFSRLAPWTGDIAFPRERPALASVYALRRYVLPRLHLVVTPNELPPEGAADPAILEHFRVELAKLAAASGRPVPGIILLYPKQTELQQSLSGKHWLPESGAVIDIAKLYGVQVVDLARDPRWSVAYYRDGTHPTVEGNRALAQIIAESLRGIGVASSPASH